MSTEENKRRVRSIFEEGVNRKQDQVYDDLLSPDYVNHGFPLLPPGPEGLKQAIAMFRAGFPDMHVTVEDVVAEGDRVASRGRMSGTHRGEFMGVPATGRSVDIGYSDIWRVQDGRLIENWVQLDLLGLMQQLGVIPAPEAAPPAS